MNPEANRNPGIEKRDLWKNIYKNIDWQKVQKVIKEKLPVVDRKFEEFLSENKNYDGYVFISSDENNTKNTKIKIVFWVKPDENRKRIFSTIPGGYLLTVEAAASPTIKELERLGDFISELGKEVGLNPNRINYKGINEFVVYELGVNYEDFKKQPEEQPESQPEEQPGEQSNT
jgi:hypothetical protein